MSKKQIYSLIGALILAFLVRLYFVPAPGYERDIQLFKIWSQTAVQNGVHNVYDKTWCDYPPGYLYVLQATGFVYHLFYPNFDEHTYLFNFLIKFPPILADLLTAIIIFLVLREKLSFKLSLLLMAAYAFNPVIIFNSAYWGQIDSIPTMFTLLAVLALIKEKDRWEWALTALAILIKTQFVVFLPIIILITWKRKGWGALLNGMAMAWLTSVVVLFRFFYYHKIDQVINRILNAVGEYPYLSMNAFNLWWLLSWGKARTILDTNLLMNMWTYRGIGTFLLFMAVALLLWYLFRKEKEEQALYLTCAATFFSFFMLPTEMHERYLFPFFIFLLLAAVGDLKLSIVYALLSLAALLNMYMVLGWAYANNAPLTPLLGSLKIDLIVSVVNAGILFYLLGGIMKEIKFKYVVYFMIGIVVLAGAFYLLRPNKPRYLSDLQPKEFYQQWGSLQKDRSIDGHTLTVNGFMFSKGLGTHANSSITYILGGCYKFIEGSVGLDSEQNRGNKIQFLIFADNKQIFDSGIVQGWIKPKYFKLPVKGVQEIRLEVKDGGDGINCDHADWLDLKATP
jgi:Gpi18-like mannosyltransferase